MNIKIDITAVLDHPRLDFKGYEFDVEGGVCIPEAGFIADDFRLEINKKTLAVTILVASWDSWHTHDNVTHLFDVTSILAECMRQEKQGEVHNCTKEYLEFLEREGELVCF